MGFLILVLLGWRYISVVFFGKSEDVWEGDVPDDAYHGVMGLVVAIMEVYGFFEGEFLDVGIESDGGVSVGVDAEDEVSEFFVEEGLRFIIDAKVSFFCDDFFF